MNSTLVHHSILNTDIGHGLKSISFSKGRSVDKFVRTPLVKGLKRKSVQFSETNRIMTIPSISQMSEEEIRDTWYGSECIRIFFSDADDAAKLAQNDQTNPTKALLKAYQFCRKNPTGNENDKAIDMLKLWCTSSNHTYRGLETGESDFSEISLSSQANVIRKVLETQRHWRASGRKIDDKFWDELKTVSENGSKYAKAFSIAMAAADAVSFKEKAGGKKVKREISPSLKKLMLKMKF